MVAGSTEVPAAVRNQSETGPAGSPVGAWTAQVSRPNGISEVIFQFTPDGRAFVVAGGAGAGTWIANGDGVFTFRIAEPLIDSTGTYLGWVDINQEAVRDDDTFTSTGTSRVYDLTDSVKYEAAVSISARANG